MSKKILIPISVIVLIISLVALVNQGLFSLGQGYIKYRYFTKESEALDFTEVSENPFDKYLQDDIPEPLDNPKQAEDPQSSVSDLEKAEPQVSPDNSSSGNQTSTSNNPAPPTSVGKPTVAQISREYMEIFTRLEASFRDDLQGLVSDAIRDYNSGSYGKMNLADMYLQKGEALEKSSDEKFYKLLDDLEAKLAESSHNTTMVKDVEAYYKKFKEFEKNRILDKGMALLEE